MIKIKEVLPHELLYIFAVHPHSLRTDLFLISCRKNLFSQIEQGQGFGSALRGFIKNNDIKETRFCGHGFINPMQGHDPDRNRGSAGIKMTTGIVLMRPGVFSGSFAEFLHGLLPSDHVASDDFRQSGRLPAAQFRRDGIESGLLSGRLRRGAASRL